MAKDSLALKNALFQCKAGGTSVPFLIGSPKSDVGQCAPTGVGLCNTHRNSLPNTPSASGYVQLNNSLFFINEALNGRISFVRTKIRESNPMVYGEYTPEGSAPICFTCSADKISYRQGEQIAHPYECIPIVAYAIAFDDEVRHYSDACMASSNYDNALSFNDSMYYDFACQFKDKEYVTDDDLVLETIKSGFQAGSFEDMSPFVGGSGCTLFSSLTERSVPGTDAGGIDMDLFSDYRDGRHRIKYPWAPDQLRYIPPVSSLDDFIPTKKAFDVIRHIESKLGKALKAIDEGRTCADDKKKYVINILLYGDPGTGKSRLMHAIGAMLGLPVYITTLTEDSEGDEFTGKTKLVSGKFASVETEFLKGWQNGGIVLLEEINLARSNVSTGELNQALEYPYVIMKDGYEKVTRNPLTIVVGTMNLGTDGTTALNSALSQRFIHKYEVHEASSEEVKNILQSYGYRARDINCIYDVYTSIRETLKGSRQMSRYIKELSIRQCVGALELMDEGRDARSAVIDTMYGALCVKDRSVADNIFECCIDSMRELSSYPDVI